MKSTFAQYAKGPMGLLIALSSCVSAFLTGLIYLLVCIKAWAGAFGLGTATQYYRFGNKLFRRLLGTDEVHRRDENQFKFP